MAIGLRSMGAVVAAIALLSGCGSGGETEPRAKANSTKPSPKPLAGLTAQQILDKSKAAAVASGSVHVSGDSDGITMDLRATKAGDGKGTMSYGAGGVDGTVELLVRDGQLYVKGDKRFWTKNANKAVAQILTGKWLMDDKLDPQFGDLAEILDLDKFLEEGLKPEGTISIAKGRDVGGQATVGLLDTSAKGGNEGTLYIADADKPFPLLAVNAKGEEMAFSEWGASVTVAAPPEDLVIDIAELQNAA
jgi:hypothetical protein